MSTPAANRFVVGLFLAVLAGVPLGQAVIEWRSGARPAVLDLFRQAPTPANLRAYERELETASVPGRWLGAAWRAGEFLGLGQGGRQAAVGPDGWLFYQPGINTLTQRRGAGESDALDAAAACIRFRDRLARRGIRLLLLPVPNKESVYPDRLSRWASPPGGILNADTRRFLDACGRAGLEVVDVFGVYRAARAAGGADLYLVQDSHWSPEGLQAAAAAVARRLLSLGWVTAGPAGFGSRTVTIERHGDLVRMLRSPALEAWLPPERVACRQVVATAGATPYADQAGSAVLVLGDSFLRIFERDEPGSAGFIAHLAAELGRPVASLVNDGGGATLVRQDLFRHPSLLAGKAVVVWEFVERDLRLGAEGWQDMPLPDPVASPP